MFLFVGGSKHVKYLNVKRNYKITFPRILLEWFINDVRFP